MQMKMLQSEKNFLLSQIQIVLSQLESLVSQLNSTECYADAEAVKVLSSVKSAHEDDVSSVSSQQSTSQQDPGSSAAMIVSSPILPLCFVCTIPQSTTYP